MPNDYEARFAGLEVHAGGRGFYGPGITCFYTRLLASSNTKVEHRWYRNDREQKVVPLSITASPGVGYRTISSTNISADRPGKWRVEVRAADGTVCRNTPSSSPAGRDGGACPRQPPAFFLCVTALTLTLTAQSSRVAIDFLSMSHVRSHFDVSICHC